jgi:hypothetical protein
MVAHVVTLSMLALMLGLIHVAPLSATPAHSATGATVKDVGHGFLQVNALPWAKILIDGLPYGETPLARPIELKEGSHAIRFLNDWYLPVDRTVEINEGTAAAPKVLSLDFEAEHVPTAPGATRPTAPGTPAAGGGK